VQHRFNFTEERLRRFTAPAEGEVYLFDAKTTGLICRVWASGAKVFYLQRRFRGRPRKWRIGRFGETKEFTPGGDVISEIAAARAKASEMIAQIERGEDPRPDRLSMRATLGDVFADWLEKKAKIEKKSWGQDSKIYASHLRRHASKVFDEIDRDWLGNLHRSITKKAPIAANRVLALMSVLHSHRNGRGAPNPCRDVPRNPEKHRARRLSAEELPRFVAAIDRYESGGGKLRRDHADILRVLLWTGQRRGNVFAMRWADLDLDSGAWTIPGEVFKNGQPHVAILPDVAVSVLRSRRDEAASEYVFPGRRSGAKSQHVTDIRKAWRAVLADAGIDHRSIRLHDLRATFATIMAEQNENIQSIAGQLGHKSIATTQRYVRMAQKSVRLAVDRTTAAMDEMIRRKESA
jgi:integrase